MVVDGARLLGNPIDGSNLLPISFIVLCQYTSRGGPVFLNLFEETEWQVDKKFWGEPWP